MNRRIREHHWRLLKQTIDSEKILTSVRILEGNRLDIQTVTWNEYWGCLVSRLPKEFQAKVHFLKESRCEYFVTATDIERKKAYCQSYFRLLDSCLELSLPEELRREFLHKIVSFETAYVWNEQKDDALMVVNNMTNPAYLVSRIRYPQVLDDPKYLPLIAMSADGADTAALYYRYRQFAPGKRHPLRLMVYMPVCKENRFAAFRTYHHFQDALVSKNDTRCRERATTITEAAIRPISKNMMQGESSHLENTLSIADVGGGTGELGRHIFEQLLSNDSEFAKQRIEWEIIDVDFKNFQRHLKNHKIGQLLHVVRCKRQNMCEWIASKQSNPNEKPFDIILLCRILNNLSDYTIMPTTCWYEAVLLAGKPIRQSDCIHGKHLPVHALSSEGNSDNLIIMNSTVRVRNGTVFRQLSLSRYFQAVHEVCRLPLPSPVDETTVFYPLRSFSEQSLLMPDGQNILSRLCSLGKCVIIEDVDLDAIRLKRFMQKHGLNHLAATDLTRMRHLTTSNLLCIVEKTDEHLLPGVKIW